MKYYTLILFLLFIGCEKEPLVLKNYLQNKALEGKKLLYSSRTTGHYTDTIHHAGNCIMIDREYPEIKVSDINGTKSIVIPPSNMIYKICLQSNVLYGSEGENNKDKHIILSPNDWSLDGVDCKITKKDKVTIQKLDYDTLLAACSDGSYVIYAKGLGMVESGYQYPNKIIESRLIQIIEP